MQESSRGADHGSDLRLHVSLYAGNCSEHVCTLVIGYKSGGTPGFHTSSRRMTEIAGRRRGSSASSTLPTSRLFVLPVVARQWVSVDNSRRVRWLRAAALHAAPPRATAGRPRRRRKPLAAPPAMALCHGSARAGRTGCNNRSDQWLPFYSFDKNCRLHNNSRKNPKIPKLVLFECADLNI